MNPIVTLVNDRDTANLASILAEIVNTPINVFLQGDLGVGKTFFVRSFMFALNYQGLVKSPTYNILETYKTSKGLLNHFDLYRFQSPIEWYDLGFDEVFRSADFNFIEWPEKIKNIEIPIDLELIFQYQANSRQVEINSLSNSGEKIGQLWIKNLIADKP